MIENKIGDTFEDMDYEEMTLAQVGVDLSIWPPITLTYCPLPITITVTN
jgi:hypothetical protein